jgi:hypothetical protein
MLNRCPYCGNKLARPIRNGIKSCPHCHSFFTTTKNNQLLSAAWELRKSRTNLEQFKFYNELSDDESSWLYHFVVEEGYTHDEMCKIIGSSTPFA